MSQQSSSQGLDGAADADAMRAFGRALAVLRTRAGLSRTAAAGKLGVTVQAWGKYENGRMPGIFRPSVQHRLAAAVGASVADLKDEVARQAPKPADEDWTEGGRFLAAEDAA